MTITQITTQLTSHVTNPRHYQHISNYWKWMDKPIGFWYFLEALSVTVYQSWLSVSTQREKSCLFQLCNIQTLLNICKRKPWNSAVAKYGFFKHPSTDMQTFKYANRTCINTKGTWTKYLQYTFWWPWIYTLPNNHHNFGGTHSINPIAYASKTLRGYLHKANL